MRRGLLILMVLVPFSTPALAQVPVVVDSGVVGRRLQTTPALAAAIGANDVVARVMSFDRDRDGKVQRGELAERMQPLLLRGDADGDGALDGTEIRQLAAQRRPETPFLIQGLPFAGSYTFADQVELSSRSHVEGAIEDLRLAGPVRDHAIAAATAYIDRNEQKALADLQTTMERLLAPEQLVDFRWTIVSRTRRRSASPAGDAGAPAKVVSARSLDPTGLIQRYSMTPEQRQHANVAIEQYKSRVRLGEKERSELLEQVKDLLSLEEAGNLRAALERRPLVATDANRILMASVRLAELADRTTRVLKGMQTGGEVVIEVPPLSATPVR
jgi:hypothetical protein